MNEDPRPKPPEKPLPGDCCGSGCMPCVLEAYEDAMDQHHARLLEWLARHPPASDPGRMVDLEVSCSTRLVLDTNVSLDLFVFEDPRWQPLREALSRGRCQAVIDAACRREFMRVLGYAQFSLSPRAQVRAIQQLDTLYRHVELREEGCAGTGESQLPRCADADDQKFLELALRAHARVILSKDKALLKLDRRLRRMGLFGVMQPQDWLALHAPESVVPARGA